LNTVLKSVLCDGTKPDINFKIRLFSIYSIIYHELPIIIRKYSWYTKLETYILWFHNCKKYKLLQIFKFNYVSWDGAWTWVLPWTQPFILSMIYHFYHCMFVLMKCTPCRALWQCFSGSFYCDICSFLYIKVLCM
jgi:hypothetical protein